MNDGPGFGMLMLMVYVFIGVPAALLTAALNGWLG
jgi:hypothetical protein